MAVFDSKIFNPEVFGRYVDRVPRVKQNKFLEAGILKPRNELKSTLSEQSGGNFVSVPMYGLLDGTPLNYDGNTDLTATSTKTYLQSMVVIGRMKAWVERDFSGDISSANFMNNVAEQVVEYWQDVDQGTILSILKGIFSMTACDFTRNHTYDVTSAAEKTVGATTLNNALQRASGDNKAIFKVAIMHSAVSTNLENLQLITYLKYTDSKGIEKDLGIGTWNGRLVLVDDSCPVENGYVDAASTDVGALKVVASNATGAQINLADVTNYFGSKALAANDYVVAGSRYITYVLGDGAFDFCDVGVAKPHEMDRDPVTNGGQDTLYTRQRKVFAPRGISFTMSSMASLSPTNAELENGSNWEVVNDGAATKTYINHKAIPIARIISLG